ncbi:MAG: lysine transporter LysE [Thermoprotei archaeon]|nr:MAG: lysine transporter LysE [Thermoprotei archaeon]
MDVYSFIAEVVFITSSGALSPGPLSIATFSEGAKRGWISGFFAALGHTAVELPLVILLAIGLSSTVAIEENRKLIALLGGISLLIYSTLELIGAIKMWRGKSEMKTKTGYRGGFYVGIVLSALNPFFLAWWATVGVKLIADALLLFRQSLVISVAILYLSHVWMDYAWLTFLSYLGYKGKKLGLKKMAIILSISSAILAYFGVEFIVSAVN